MGIVNGCESCEWMCCAFYGDELNVDVDVDGDGDGDAAMGIHMFPPPNCMALNSARIRVSG